MRGLNTEFALYALMRHGPRNRNRHFRAGESLETTTSKVSWIPAFARMAFSA